MSPMAFRIRVRMNRARNELPFYSVAEVARDLGFGDAKHFSRIFKKHTGLAPRDYKKMVQNGDGLIDRAAHQRPIN